MWKVREEKKKKKEGDIRENLQAGINGKGEVIKFSTRFMLALMHTSSLHLAFS